MISVADRFSFTLTEIKQLRLRELEFWYNASIELGKQERAMMGIKDGK